MTDGTRTKGRALRPIAVASQLPPPVHGSTVMTEALVKTLEALGEDVVVLDKGFSRRLDDIGAFRWRKVVRLPLNLLSGAATLATRRPEMCIFFLTCNRSSLVADALMIAIVRTFRCPVVHYLHGRGYSELARRSRVNRHLLKWIFKRAEHVVTLTPSLFSDVVDFVDEESVITIPNAIEAAPVAQRNGNGERVTVLFLSNFDRTKGALDLVLATHRLAHLRLRMRVVLAGGIVDPAFYEELRREIESREMQDYVELRGPAYGEEKQRLLTEADVFVFPTYYAFETFGLVNLEAMRAGLPVISTRVGGIPDVVKDGVTGYLIEARDHHALAHHLERLVQDGGLRQRLGQQARARFEDNYTFAHFADNWSEALSLLREPTATTTNVRAVTVELDRIPEATRST